MKYVVWRVHFYPSPRSCLGESELEERLPRSRAEIGFESVSVLSVFKPLWIVSGMLLDQRVHGEGGSGYAPQ